jgi:hypothetical protein
MWLCELNGDVIGMLRYETLLMNSIGLIVVLKMLSARIWNVEC